MDPRERINSFESALRAALDGRQAQIWTALPCTIVSFNAAAQTAQVQPMTLMQYTDPATNAVKFLQLPVINDVLVQFPSGGGFTLTFPVAAGDECLVVFASRCIDGWYATGQIQQQGDLRMHDLSDGFALVGVRSRPNALTGVSTSAVQLRNDAGTSFVEVEANGSVQVTTPGVSLAANAAGGVSLSATGQVLIAAAQEITIHSTQGLALIGPTGSITANGNVLG